MSCSCPCPSVESNSTKETVRRSSYRNAVRTIALIDLTFVTIPLTFETMNVGYMLGFMDPFDYLKEDCEKEERQAYCSWAFTAFRKLSEIFSSEEVPTKVQTFTVMSLIIFVLMGAIVEGYLFAILRRGVREEIYFWCKRWFWIRLLLLIWVGVPTILKIVRSHYIPLLDGFYDFTKIYRVGSLLIVLLYMKELEKTVGVVYVRPMKKPKKGSLGQDVHLLDG